ncbi:MAG: pectate lyase [Planctomycetota bacterium]|jgi:PelA/Pel-15E family pectate lyase
MRSERLYRSKLRLVSSAFYFWLVSVFSLLGHVRGDPLTPQRLGDLPSSERQAWQDYLDRSNAWRKRIQDIYASEATVNRGWKPKLASEGSDFRLPEKKSSEWYAGPEAIALSDVLISFQNPSGGWSKHVSVDAGPRTAGVHWSSQGTVDQPRYIGTFDNGSTTNQLLFLTRVYRHTKSKDLLQSIQSGLRYILDAQYPNGGWPQVYPLEGGYHDDITFNDDAMVHVLSVLDLVGKREEDFDLVDESMRQECRAAFQRGVNCILQAQCSHGPTRTLWCAQHDALTLSPSRARAMEPASLSGSESVGILKLLMAIDDPTQPVITSIQDGLKWFSEHQVRGLRRTKIDGQDRYVNDPQSEEIYWARFYDLHTQEPIYPGRDGVVYRSYQELASRNRLGYDYLTTKPKGLLASGQKSWAKRLEPKR